MADFCGCQKNYAQFANNFFIAFFPISWKLMTHFILNILVQCISLYFGIDLKLAKIKSKLCLLWHFFICFYLFGKTDLHSVSLRCFLWVCIEAVILHKTTFNNLIHTTEKKFKLFELFINLQGNYVINKYLLVNSWESCWTQHLALCLVVWYLFSK